MTPRMYNTGVRELGSGGDTNWEQDTIKVLLLDDTYTFDASHEFVNDLTGELTGTGYERKTLTGKSATLTGNEYLYDAADIEWDDLDPDQDGIKHIVFFREGADDTDSVLLSSVERDQLFDPAGATYRVELQDGVIKATAQN